MVTFRLTYISFYLVYVHLCAKLTEAPWMLEPFEEVGAIFLYNFHREHSFMILLKLSIKKLSPKHTK